MTGPVELKPLPPKEAIDYFRSKGLKPSFAWQDVWQEEHARAFTVAKSCGYDILGDVRQAVDKALAEGQTLDQFREGLTPLLQAKGWWGKQRAADPLTGEERLVQLGSPRRLQTIYETNLRTAYQAGRWERIQAAKKALPFLRYSAVMDARTRPEHRAWNGTILRVDDPWWQTHYPPCGWRCRCNVVQMNQRMLDRADLKVTDEPVRFPPKTYTNPRTGETSRLEQGIDPGWAYNVGEARMEALAPKPSPLGVQPDPAAPARTLPPIAARPGPELLPAGTSAEEAQAAFLGRLDLAPGESRIDLDPAGEPLVLGDGLFRNSAGRPAVFSAEQLRRLPLAADALLQPDEIRWIWRIGAEGVTPQLLRRYLARRQLADQVVDVAVDVAGGGSPSWAFATSLDEGFSLDRLRRGLRAWSYEPPTPAELEALTRYTGFGHDEINGYLRRGDDAPPQLRRTVNALDRLLGRQVLPRAGVVYRGIGGSAVREHLQGIAEGSIITDVGFMSTSRSRGVAASFAQLLDDEDSVIMLVRTPAGPKAMDVAGLSEHPTELETLFARGARLKVLSWDPDERVLEVEVILGD